MGQKGACPRSRDLLLNFGIPLLSLDRLKLQTSNFASGLRAGMLTRPEVDEAEAEANSHEAEAKIALIFPPKFTF